MKKIYYLLAFVALAFTACQKQPVITPGAPSEVKPLTLTLQPTDYQQLPSADYPHSTLTIDDDADAENYIPIILNAEYSRLGDGSTAAVTYTKSALYFKLKDSVLTDVAYTLTNADYLLLPGNKYADFSIAQALAWLPYKYPTPVNNQLVLLNFTVYPATTVPPPPYSFLYLNGAWKQIYTIQPAQYTSIGLGKYDQFTSANDAKQVSYLSALLKADITIQDTVQKGDVVYVSFGYYNSGDFQRVLPLVYDGNNYIAPSVTSGTLNFIKKSGSWIFVQPLPVVNYTLTAADITLISNSTFGTSALRSNLASYGDFETSWAKADLQGAFIACLTVDITAPQTNTIYKVHYKLYSGGADVDTTLSFEWDGSKWVAQ